ncbi:MAG: 5-formyltetrahydrofolate cyclo-ligase [Gammaproteobacteria bacterium]|nr:5-formyltetrahydrofolate cyclo-ligase [Gammaproteobacteria bacterium]MDH5693572.1 5-formyltetrahydrofolate cyclo-ligase [Gammaproteobacteria bacterium]
MSDNKASLRREIRQKRLSLTEQERADASIGLWQQLKRNLAYLRFNSMAFYLANDGELDPAYARDYGLLAGNKVYLPALHRSFRFHMRFAPYMKNCRLTENKFGIPEPQCALAQLRYAGNLDAIFIPLVAFDKKGNRLGMGGGYYDRTLAFLRTRRIWKKPLLVGLAYDFQQVDSLPSDPWDIPMQYLVTPSRVIKV